MLTQEDIPLCIPGYKHLQDVRSIIRFEGNGNYTLVHLSTHSRPLLVSQTLKRFEDKLTSFIRVSKSDLINPNYVQKVIIKNTKVMHIQITKGPRLLVSRRRMVETLARLDLSTESAD